MAERIFRGQPASPGVALGPLLRWHAAQEPAVRAGAAGPEAEHARLERAIARARAELARLGEGDDPLAGEILEFQREFLSDPAFLDELRTAIGRGRSADVAMRAVLDGMIAEFRAETEEYFRARAEDLVDLRDRLLDALMDRSETAPMIPRGAILLASELAPSRFLALLRQGIRGVALEAGSATSHTAMLARARGVPLVVGLGPVEGEAVQALVEGEEGLLVLDPGPALRRTAASRALCESPGRAARRLRGAGAVTTASGEPVEIRLNVDDPDLLEEEAVAASDGAGLVRTEFLFTGRDRLPDEEEQYEAYRTLVARFAGRPVRFRTLDVGGDKPLAGVTVAGERNPFLGLRGIRLSLARPDIFEPQLRALLRAARHGPVEIMLPMVTLPGEVARVRALLARLRAELAAKGAPVPEPPLGIMVEVPAAALTLERFEVDFVSIGSNDLVQYVMAAARDATAAVAELADPLHPAVLRLVAEIVEVGARRGIPVSLCGEMAGDPEALRQLLALGLRSVSVPVARLPATIGAVTRFGALDERTREP